MNNNNIKRDLLYMAIALAIAIIAILSHVVINKMSMSSSLRNDSERLQKTMLVHEQRMNNQLDRIMSTADIISNDNIFIILDSICSDNKYSYYVFQHDSLIGWHNAVLPLSENNLQNSLSSNIIKTDNGWYFIVSKQNMDISVYSIFCIKSKYHYDNEYLQTVFDNTLLLNNQDEIVIDSISEGCKINNTDNEYLFTIIEIGSESVLPSMFWSDCISLIIWLFAVLLCIKYLVQLLVDSNKQNRILWIVFIVSAAIYIWALSISISAPMLQTFLFSSQVYAYAWWIPSLAYLLLLSILMLVCFYYFYRYFDSKILFESNIISKKINIKYIIAFAIIYLIYSIINLGIDSLIFHSNDLAIYVGNLDVSGPTLVKIVILTYLTISFLLLISKIYVVLSSNINNSQYVFLLVLFTIVVVIPTYLLLSIFDIYYCIGFVVFNIMFFVIKRKTGGVLKFSMFVWVMSITALLMMARITNLNIEKENKNRTLLTNNLSFQLIREDDPVAEHQILSFENKLTTDTIIQNILLSVDNIERDNQLYSYLRENYFNGYLSRFDLQVIPCYGNDSKIQMSNSGEQYNCYEYFNELINKYGNIINSKSNFYCFDDIDGRPCYFGQIKYDKIDYRLYLEINLKLYSDEIGYPELLTNKRDRLNMKQLKGYSYAKYFDNILSTKYGDYDYPNSNNWIGNTDSIKYKTITTKNYSHSIYHVLQNQEIVLSYPTMTIGQFITDFSFLFLSIFLISIVTLKLIGRNKETFFRISSILERIQSTFVLFVIMLLVVLCIIAGKRALDRYETNSRSKMSTVLNSIKKATLMNLPEYENINDIDVDNILRQVSTMFDVDVHMYSLDGRMIGTSRRELFNNGITSSLINSQALSILRDKNRGEEVFVRENIGQLEYYSIYTPFINYYGKTIGYLNVPYFTDLNAMRNQLLSTFVPITSSYMLIILFVVLFSYFLAQGITKPLISIRENMRKVGLQKNNEKINYPNDDEIGALVKEYNRMLDELAYSAEKLAASEREFTWREMARQIAHEIKNPLTPMKLSVQYLIKAWDAKRDDFDAFIHKVAITLTEQIDQLSYIASQFSNLAKMQNNVPLSRIDVAERLANTIMLFERTENAQITLSKNIDSAFVYANADQMTSVFNNLIKNAIQAVRNNETIIINASIDIVDEKVIIKIADNGHGIAPEIQEKIFKPNFTTKSTGMGLGLAIVKNIILNSHGDIRFETEIDKGTTFYIELPIYNE